MDVLCLDNLRIDSLVDLLKVSFSLEDWDKMIEIADKLYTSAQEVLDKQIASLQSGNRYVYNDRKRHIIYYLGFSQLAKGIALQNKELYEESKVCIERYADFSSLNDGSDEAAKEIEIFNLFAKANTYAVNLLEGNLEFLETYMQFLRDSREDEIMPGLLTIVEADIKNNFNIDIRNILNSFADSIEKAIEYYTQKKPLYLIKFYYKLSLYYFLKKQHSVALDNNLEAIELSITFKDAMGFKKCVALFESFRIHANKDQQHKYVIFMNKVLKEELVYEKSIYYNGDYIGVN